MPPRENPKLTKWIKHHKYALHQWLSNDNVNTNHLGVLVKMQILIQVWGGQISHVLLAPR